MGMKISDRLRVVYDNLLVGKDVWDFCCDHGYLGVAAYKSRKFADVFFVDQVDSIIAKLKNNFNTFVHDDLNPSQVHFILERGELINRDVGGTVCISGVGAFVIYDILCGLAKKKFLSAERLILGPHRDTEKLIKMLANEENLKNYELSRICEVTENERKRSLLIFDRRKIPLSS